jgi:hypothetical protein
LTKPIRGWLCYPVALAVGVLFAASIFPWHLLWPAMPLDRPVLGDEAVMVVGQRYFLAAPWQWPPLTVMRLGAPEGTNIGLTDSIPLAMLVAKLFRAWLPPGFFMTAAWAALAWALQPAAAIFALRSAGERRALPMLAVAVLAISMPTFLGRFGHMALCTHAAILVALGLYLRLVAGACRWPWVFGSLLLLCSLLIHPYILAMTAGVLAATPLTLLLRRDRRWLRATIWLGCTIAAVAGIAIALGYGGTELPYGFGVYSMNLLAPFLPGHSSFFRDVTIDATGGQFIEGFQYLGAGMLALLLVTAIPAVWGRGRLPWGRHAGLLLVVLGMALFALSNRVFLGHRLLVDIQGIPAAVMQFRATGRFFWPFAYTAMVAAVLVAARAFPRRFAVTALVLAAGLQFGEAGSQRRGVHYAFAVANQWKLDEPRLAPLFAAHDRLTLWPTFGCGASVGDDATIQVMLLASRTTMQTNTMFSARDRANATCDPTAVLTSPVQPGELRVIQRPGDVWLVPDAARLCHRSGAMLLCSADTRTMSGLPALQPVELPLGQDLEFSQQTLLDALGGGWSMPNPGGTWTDHGTAALVFHRATPGALVMTLTAVGIGPKPGTAQPVAVAVNGSPVAQWQVPDMAEGHFQVPIPAGEPGTVVVTLTIAHPTRPVDRGMNDDPRQLGFLLRRLRLDSAAQ